METPSSSPKVRRAARVYGRRKQPEVSGAETSADLSFTTASPAVSNDSSPSYAASQYDLPPSSDDLGVGDTSYMDEDDGSHDEVAVSVRDDNDDDIADEVAPTRYVRRSVREELALIDQQFDEEDMDIEPQRGSGAQDKADDGLLSNEGASHTSADPLDGPLPVLSGSSQPAEARSPSPSPIPRRTTKRRLQLNDSDSDSPIGSASRTSPQTSPSALHPISTPNTRSSHTPPTSQDMSASRRQRKGKERSQAAGDSDAQPTTTGVQARRKSTSTRKTREKRIKVSHCLAGFCSANVRFISGAVKERVA